MAALEDDFAGAIAALDQALVIVTAHDGREPAGCLVGFHTQTSIAPRRYLACLSQANRTHGVACAAEALLVHVVPERAAALAELFGGASGDAVDKFARVGWRRGPGGAPLLDGLDTWVAGRVVERVGLGDHTGFLLAPTAAAAGPAAAPLRLRHARRIAPGHPA